MSTYLNQITVPNAKWDHTMCECLCECGKNLAECDCSAYNDDNLIKCPYCIGQECSTCGALDKEDCTCQLNL